MEVLQLLQVAIVYRTCAPFIHGVGSYNARRYLRQPRLGNPVLRMDGYIPEYRTQEFSLILSADDPPEDAVFAIVLVFGD